MGVERLLYHSGLDENSTLPYSCGISERNSTASPGVRSCEDRSKAGLNQHQHSIHDPRVIFHILLYKLQAIEESS